MAKIVYNIYSFMEFTGIKEKAKPYTMGQSDTLALLVHGFTGSPDDLRDLAAFLSENGVAAKAVLLPGHGSDWKDLRKVTYNDWINTIEEEFNAVKDQYKKIFLIGYSFGSNLAYYLAARYGDKIAGVVSLGTSVYLRREWKARLVLPFYHLLIGSYKKTYIKPDMVNDYLDRGCYVTVPSKGVFQFYLFIDRFTKKELGKVKVPCLIIHSKDDSVTHPRSSEFVYDHLGSEKKELLILDDINHNPLVSLRKDVIFTKIKEFISKN